MTFLPIVGRELRVASRRRGTYWLRSGAALLVLLIGLFLLVVGHTAAPQEMAQVLFAISTGCATFYSLFSGIRATADCLSEEKREGTLGLLFLTDLKGYDVVFGKFAATSLNAFYGVLAVVPMLAIPLLLGGVTAGEFWRMALVAVNTLFFSLSVGICISSLCRSGQKAVMGTALLIVLLTGGLPALGGILANITKSAQVSLAFLLPSPGYSYYRAWDLPYKAKPGYFWFSLLLIHGLGWLSLLLASVIVPRTWQERPAGAQRVRWRERWQAWSYGTAAERVLFRRHLLDRNAFYWLVARMRWKPALVWAVLGVLACGWIWGALKYRREWLDPGTYIATAVIVNLMLRSWFTSEAARQLAEDRKAGALELLLSTPMAVPDILRGQWLALKRQFLGPVVAVLAVEFLFLLTLASDPTIGGDRDLWVSLWLAGMFMLVADLVALFYVAMWQGLTARNPHRAASAAAVRILVVPWVAYAVVICFMALASYQNRSPGPDPGWHFFLGLWFFLGLATDLFFGAMARTKLLNEFRTAAAQRFASQPGFWQRLFGGTGPSNP